MTSPPLSSLNVSPLQLTTLQIFTDIINSTKISLVASEIQVMMNSTLVQTQEFVKSSDLLQATVISMLFVLAYWSIIYMDSYQPGKFPPSPLSVFDKER